MWDLEHIYSYSGPYVLLSTKTLWGISQFLDNLLFIVFHYYGYIWWCLVLYSIIYMLLGVFFFNVQVAGSVHAITAVGPTVHCLVIDDIGYQIVPAKRFSLFNLSYGV